MDSTARIFDARDYGAVGDGVANDRAAIQRAVDAAAEAGGGTVYLSSGVYVLDTAGVNKTNAGIQLRDNVSLIGDGPGATTLKIADGNNRDVTGVIRTPFGVETHNVTVANLTIDGNRDASTSGKVDGFYCGTAPGSTAQDSDITVRNVEIMDCSGYGFDPHEQTLRLTIEDCVAHGNGLDGFTLDYIIDSTIRNNVAYDNDRHGFNVVTSSHDSLLEGNVAYGNGGNGITVQRGGEDIPSPQDLIIRGGEVYDNGRSGILLQMTSDVTVDGVHIHDNAREGVKLYGSSDVTITGSRLENNSRAGDGTYSEIYLTSVADDVTGRTWTTSGATIVDNTISETGPVRAGYGVRETPETSGSYIDGNTISGTAKGASLTGPQVREAMPDLEAPAHAFQVTIAASAYRDIDAQDTVTLSLQRVDAAGALVDGGALPAWLSFDPATRTISGRPTEADAGAIHLRIAATDRAGDTEYDRFVLTIDADNDGYQAAPVVSAPIADQDAVAGQPFSLTIPADAFTDPDAGALTYTAALADGAALPAWLSFDPVARTLSGAPAAGDLGALEVRVTATDPDQLAASDVFVLNVAAGGRYAGTAGSDVLVGSAGQDVLEGFGGADRLDGRGGGDQMTGGDGDDVYVVDDLGDVVVEAFNSGAGGVDTVEAWISYVLPGDVENLALMGAADLAATGNNKANRITGNAGANLIDGGAGNDVMAGGAGNDNYRVGQTGDQVVEAAGEGIDTVISAVSFTLGANIENLTLEGTVSTATGNQADNVLKGNAAANKLYGLEGADTLDGGGGADSLYGGAGDDLYYVDADDTVIELAGEGADTVMTAQTHVLKANVETLVLTGSAAVDGTGNSGANSLVGNGAANVLNGQAGDDRLQGGGGADILTGGGGADRFVFGAVSDSPLAQSDLITDFKARDGDRLDVSGIDADLSIAGDQAFVLTQAFSHRAGEMTSSYDSAVNQTILAFDLDGDGSGAEFSIRMTGQISGSDWLIL